MAPRDDERVLEHIRRLMDVGLLPIGAIGGRRVGVGSMRQRCDGCDEEVAIGEPEIELTFFGTLVVHLHPHCANLYEAELRRRGVPPSC